MPARIIDPELQAAVIRQFNLRGALAPFNLTEDVVPVFDIGSLLGNLPTVVTTLAGSTGVRMGTPNAVTYMTVEGTRYDDSDSVNSGAVSNPAAAAVIVDTGQLAAGATILSAIINWNTAILDFQIEWRNAANSANLAVFGLFCGTGQPSVQWGPWVFQMGLNERLRVVTASGGTGTADATIMFNGISTSTAQ